MLLLVFKTDTEKPAVNNVWLQLFTVYLFMYLFRFGRRGSSLTVGRGLLPAVASLVVEDGLEGAEASGAAAPGSRAQAQ